MAEFEIPENPVYTKTVNKLTTEDMAYVEQINAIYKVIFENDSYFSQRVNELFKHLADSTIHVTEEKKTEWDASYEQSKAYTDEKQAELIDAAPDKLDSIGKLASALEKNQDIVETLQSAVGDKLNSVEFKAHADNGNIHYTKERIVDFIYPVGSIYQSSKPTDPGTLFGGIWQPVEDVVLVGAGTVFGAGTTGGDITHTLSAANMPAHNHSFAGAAVNTGANNVTPSATFIGTAVASDKQSANHTHNVTAKGSISSDSHAHVTNLQIIGSNSQYTTPDCPTNGNFAAVYSGGQNTWGYITSSDSHRHTFSGTAAKSGNNSADHNHEVTAKGTVALKNTAHVHTVTAAGTVGISGSGTAVNHMPPYKVIFVWERIS